MQMKKVGRNKPCPCGSGKKYKKCHGHFKDINIGRIDNNTLAAVVNLHKMTQEHERRRKLIYGEGKDIITVEHGEHRFVAVGNELHFAKADEVRYFSDFLITYLGSVLGRSWIDEQCRLNPVNRHQLIKWHDHVVECRRGLEADKNGQILVPTNGAFLSELRIANDLYLIKHNAELQERIVARLKDQKQFQGARYELSVAATMVVAGYEVKFEDESDGSKKHSELVADSGNGNRFLVEAKSKHRHGLLGYTLPPRRAEMVKNDLRSVTHLISQALLKSSNLPFLIFIDINIPGEITYKVVRDWVREAESLVNELKYQIFPEPFPANAIIFSNDPTLTDPRKVFEKTTFWSYVYPIAIPEHEIESDEVLYRIGESMIKRTRIPNEFPEPLNTSLRL